LVSSVKTDTKAKGLRHRQVKLGAALALALSLPFGAPFAAETLIPMEIREVLAQGSNPAEEAKRSALRELRLLSARKGDPED